MFDWCKNWLISTLIDNLRSNKDFSHADTSVFYTFKFFLSAISLLLEIEIIDDFLRYFLIFKYIN